MKIEMVTIDALFSPPKTRHLRIEPRNGITDPARFLADTQGRGRLELIQDDTLFHGAVVGLGCLGVVTALTLAVEPAFWLEESCALFDYRDVRGTLIDRVRAHEWCDVVPFSGRVGHGYPSPLTPPPDLAFDAAPAPATPPHAPPTDRTPLTSHNPPPAPHGFLPAAAPKRAVSA